jgi:hypothetical protein
MCPPPTFTFSLKKIHFFAKLSILGLAFIGAFKSSTKALKGPVSLIGTKFIPSHNCWYTGVNLSTRSFMKLIQVKLATTLGYYAFLLVHQSSTWLYHKGNRFGNLVVPPGPLDIIVVVHFLHKFFHLTCLAKPR